MYFERPSQLIVLLPMRVIKFSRARKSESDWFWNWEAFDREGAFGLDNVREEEGLQLFSILERCREEFSRTMDPEAGWKLAWIRRFASFLDGRGLAAASRKDVEGFLSMIQQRGTDARWVDQADEALRVLFQKAM